MLAADFLERARDADDGLDAVLCVFDSRDRLLIGHAGPGNGEADRLVELDRELDAGAGDRVRDQLVMRVSPLMTAPIITTPSISLRCSRAFTTGAMS